MAPIVDAFLPRFFGPPIYSEQPQLIERMRVLVERTNPQGAAAMLRGMAARVSSEDLLAEIDVPLRVVGGRNDTLIPVERSQEIAAAVRGARLDVLECGHLPLYEAPQALTASLDGLLAEVAATRSCAKTAPWRTRAES
jgi:pimeloyl-ACP methyl ester carboxylesterase